MVHPGPAARRRPPTLMWALLATITTVTVTCLLLVVWLGGTMLFGVPIIGFRASCGAGVGELKAARSHILADQPGTEVGTTECRPDWDEPGRYVRASVNPPFSCETALHSFAAYYGGDFHEVARDVTTSRSGVVVRGDSRYTFDCGFGEGDYGFVLSEEPISLFGRWI